MKALKLLAAVLLLCVIGAGLYLYWQHEERYPSTRDAYIGANIIIIAPQVTGQVATIAVVENQKVAAGDLLFSIDDTVFSATVEQARAELDAATKEVQGIATQVKAAQARLDSANSAYETARKNLERTKALFDSGDVAQATLDQARSDDASAASDVVSANANLLTIQSGLAAKQDTVLANKAQLQIAEADLDWTRVVAPADGWVANLTLREGSAVAAFAPQFAIVEAADWWVDANFKETSLSRIRPGQPVTLTVDLLPDVTFTGRVASIGRGSGATFSLLPPENATGNWVKVTQRFPVRIKLDPNDAALRVGGSTRVVVDTTVAPQDGK